MNAEELFKDSMEKNILNSNFKLVFYEAGVLTKPELQKTADDLSRFRSYLKKNLLKVTDRKYLDAVDGCYVESFESGFLGAIALAFWFMKFDEDNWFNYNDVHAETSKFLGNRTLDSRIELFLLKGINVFDDDDAVIAEDVPVTINFATGRICVWDGKLFD